MAHLMDQGLDCLHLAHAFLHRDPVILSVVITLCAGRNIFKSDRNWTGCLQCIKQCLITLDTTGQFIDAYGREFFTFCLTDIKYRRDLEGRPLHFNDFL